MTIERFMVWMTFSFINYFLFLNIHPFRGHSEIVLYLAYAHQWLCLLPMFYALVQRYKTLGYPAWMAFIAPMLLLASFIPQLMISKFGLWEGVNETMVLSARNENNRAMIGVMTASLIFSILLGLFGKNQAE